MAGYIRNDAATALVKSAAREVRDGLPAPDLPRRNPDGSPPINSLKGGFALIARHAGVPVQTVLIES